MKIKFKTKERRMLEELVKKTDKEFVANNLDVTVRTIERWIAAETVPAYANRKFIAQFYNSYKAQEKK